MNQPRILPQILEAKNVIRCCFGTTENTNQLSNTVATNADMELNVPTGRL